MFRPSPSRCCLCFSLPLTETSVNSVNLSSDEIPAFSFFLVLLFCFFLSSEAFVLNPLWPLVSWSCLAAAAQRFMMGLTLCVCVRVFRLRSHIMNHNAVVFLRQTAADTTSIFHVGQSGCAPLVRLPHQPAVDCACHQEPQIILISCLRCLLLSQISLLSFSRSISI